MRSVKYSCTNKRIKWSKVNCGEVRGLSLPVLLHKHLEGLSVPQEGAEHPQPRHELLPWCGSVPALKTGLASAAFPGSSEDCLWHEVRARVGLAALCPGGDCSTVPPPWFFLHLHRVASRNRAEPGRDLLLTSPGLVPDGWVVIYISWKLSQLPELLGEEGCLLLLLLSSAWGGGCLEPWFHGAGSVTPSRNLLANNISGLLAIARWLWARSWGSPAWGRPPALPQEREEAFWSIWVAVQS